MAHHFRYPNPKTIITLAFLLSLAGGLQAQYSVPVSLAERVSHSSLIIEGRITETSSFWDADHRLIYTRNRLAVDKLFKGDVPSDTIDVITLGGIAGDQGLLISDEATLGIGQTGVFMLNAHADARKLPVQVTRKPFELYAAAQGVIHYNTQAHTAADLNENYGDITGGLHKKLTQMTGQRVRLLHAGFISFGVMAPLAPNITSFSPAIVHAGAILDPTNNVLTINGNGFGSGSGLAAVVFPNADNPVATISIAYNSVYIVSWSPTKIVIKVPYGAGTGNLTVADASGTTVTAATPLTVDYNIMAITYGGPAPAANAYQIKPMNLNGSGGITVMYSNSSANGGADFSSAPEHLAFERAADTWIKTAGYNLTISGTTASQSVANDGSNIIMLDNTGTGAGVLPAGVLGITFTWIGGCSDGTWFLTGYDMVFRRTGVSAGGAITFNTSTCAPAGGEVDFESVALHELGHSLTLGHIIDANAVNDPAKVMNYSISLGRLRRSLDYSSLAAGLYALTPSGLSYGCAPYTSEMAALANQRPSRNDCPGTFPSTPTTPGAYNISLYYSTSDRTADPSSLQMNCNASTIGRYNSVMMPIYTGSSGTTLNLSVSNYTTLVDYSACSGMGVRMVLFQASSCPGTSWSAPINCQNITGNGTLTSISGLSPNTNYILVFDGLLNTKAMFDLTLAGSILPVNLIDLKAEKVNGKASLTWSTTQETNNRGFQVEKSINGKDFTSIGMVKGKGTSTTRNDYRFVDPAPLGDIQLYRLRQIDFDGSYFLTSIVSLRLHGDDAGAGLQVVNPVGSELQLKFTVAPNGPLQIFLYDVQGRLISTRTAEATGTTLTLPTGRTMTGSGTYILRITGGGIDETRKVIHY